MNQPPYSKWPCPAEPSESSKFCSWPLPTSKPVKEQLLNLITSWEIRGKKYEGICNTYSDAYKECVKELKEIIQSL